MVFQSPPTLTSDDAMTAYTRYLEMEPASDNADAVRRRLEEMARLSGADPDPSQAP